MPRLVSIAGEQHLSRPLLLEVSPFFSRDRSFESAHGALVTSRASRERIKYLPRPDAGGRAMPPRLITNAPVNQSGSDSSRSNAIRFFAVSNNDRELIKRNKPTESKKPPPEKIQTTPLPPPSALAHLLRAHVFSSRFFFIFPPPPSSARARLLARYRAARDSPAPRFPQHPLSSLAAERWRKRSAISGAVQRRRGTREREREGGGIEGEGARQLGPRTKTKTSLTAS